MANIFNNFNNNEDNNKEINNNEVNKKDIDKELESLREEKKELEERLGKEKNKDIKYLIIASKENELNKEKYLVNYNKRKERFENKINKIIAKYVKENKLQEISEIVEEL